jgi:hypothetical protein
MVTLLIDRILPYRVDQGAGYCTPAIDCTPEREK